MLAVNEANIRCVDIFDGLLFVCQSNIILILFIVYSTSFLFFHIVDNVRFRCGGGEFSR